MQSEDPDDPARQNEVAERLMRYAAKLRAETEVANDSEPFEPREADENTAAN